MIEILHSDISSTTTRLHTFSTPLKSQPLQSSSIDGWCLLQLMLSTRMHVLQHNTRLLTTNLFRNILSIQGYHLSLTSTLCHHNFQLFLHLLHIHLYYFTSTISI